MVYIYIYIYIYIYTHTMKPLFEKPLFELHQYLRASSYKTPLLEVWKVEHQIERHLRLTATLTFFDSYKPIIESDQ